MSYKFTLDHTLEIENIHDMITIDIHPDTRCLITGGDVEIHGYLTFNGSYLTDELGEERFAGTIPLDITLPYLGGSPDVRPEVASFDYRVTGGESLTLNLEILLNGYKPVALEDVHADTMDAWIDPATPEPIIEEAVIEPFNMTPSTEESVVEPVETPPLIAEVVTLNKEQHTAEEVVEEVATPIESTSIREETIPYSPLVEIETRPVEVEAIPLETPPPVEPPVEISHDESKLASAQIDEPLVLAAEEEGVDKGRSPKLTNSAAALMNELFAMKRGTAFRESEEVPEEVEPVVTIEAVELENDKGETGEPVIITDSVARQFADGESTIKMVYVRHESETLGGVLERYAVTLDDVWNLPELADGVDVGDCVMIKYEKPI